MKTKILILTLTWSAIVWTCANSTKWRGHWSWAEENGSDFWHDSDFTKPLSTSIPKIVASTLKEMSENRNRHRDQHRNYFQSSRKSQMLENMIHDLSRDIHEMKHSIDATNSKLRQMESEQEIKIRQSSFQMVNTEESKTRKLVNRLYFTNKCGGLVELSQVTELSYVRPNGPYDFNDGPETCVWILLTNTHNQIGLTLQGLEPALGARLPRNEEKIRIGLSAQIMEKFPQSYLKLLGPRDLGKEYVAPASEVVLTFTTSNSSVENQGFRLNLRNVDKHKIRNLQTVTVHSEWNLFGDQTALGRSLRFPFGGGDYHNQTSVYFLFHPGPNRRVWASVNFPRIESFKSSLAVYKYSSEYQEFGRIAKLTSFPHSGPPEEGAGSIGDDRQFMGNPDQPLLLHLDTLTSGWGKGFTISFSYQLALS